MSCWVCHDYKVGTICWDCGEEGQNPLSESDKSAYAILDEGWERVRASMDKYFSEENNQPDESKDKK